MLIKCPECARDVSDTAPSCPGCGYTLKPAEWPPSLQARPAGLSTQDQILIEQRVTNEGPSAGVTYALWFFLGLLGGHRFYLNKPISALVMAGLSITIVGLVLSGLWWLVDAFVIPELLTAKRTELRSQLTAKALSSLAAA